MQQRIEKTNVQLASLQDLLDKQNEVEATGARRIRFRPSVRRENIRKKVQEAVGTEEDGVPAPRSRPRFRPQVSVTTYKTSD